MRHTLAYTATQATGYPNALTPVTDIFPVSGNGFLMQSDMFIYSVAAIGTGLSRVELHTPTIGAVNDLSLVQLNTSGQGFPTYPAVFIPEQPIMIKGGEALTVNFTSSSGASKCYCFVEIGETPNEQPSPPGPIYTVRFTASTTCTAGSFTTLTSVTFEQSALPAGNWVLIGGQVQSTTAVACRFFNAQSKFRPGSICVTSLNNQNHPYFLHRGNRNLLTFNSLVYPNIEVMCDSADSSQVGHLLIKRAP